MNHFTDGGYIPGIETEYNMITAMAPQIPVETINEYVQQLIGDENIVILLTAPEKEGMTLPSKENLLKWFYEAKNETIQPLEETVNNEPLLETIPTSGHIVSESQNAVFGTYEYTLSNGVKAIIKPTKLKDDQILMNSFSPGGSSYFPESEAVNIKVYGSVSTLGGLGKFNTTDLLKALAGKRVNVNIYVSLRNESVSGSSNVRDFETMLQLVYLNFTAPRADEEVFQSYMGRLKSQLESAEADPNNALTDAFIKTVYKDTARVSRLRVGDLSQVDYQTIMNWRKDRFADASDFIFVFTGNIDPETSKNLIAQYLGALPSINRKEEPKPTDSQLNEGVIKVHFDQKMENPKTTVVNLHHTTTAYSQENRLKMSLLQQILNIVYTEKVREDEGGTYGVSVSGNISRYPEGQTTLSISFDTEAAKAEYLNGIVQRELQNMAVEGPRMEDFNKAKEYSVKSFNESLEENSYWSAMIGNYYWYGEDNYSNYMKTLESITPNDIRDFAKTILDAGNSIEIIMKGVE